MAAAKSAGVTQTLPVGQRVRVSEDSKSGDRDRGYAGREGHVLKIFGDRYGVRLDNGQQFTFRRALLSPVKTSDEQKQSPPTQILEDHFDHSKPFRLKDPSLNYPSIWETKYVQTEIQQAIKLGKEMWNSGDMDGCTKMYRELASKYAEEDQRLAEALAQSKDEPASRAGWILRYAFDDIVKSTELQKPSEEEADTIGPTIKYQKSGVEVVVKQGWLVKEGAWIKSWKKRFFVYTTKDILGFTERRMSYYVDDKLSEKKGTIDLSNMDIAKLSSKVQCGFEVICPDRTWYLKTEARESAQAWVEVLNRDRRCLSQPTREEIASKTGHRLTVDGESEDDLSFSEDEL